MGKVIAILCLVFLFWSAYRIEVQVQEAHDKGFNEGYKVGTKDAERARDWAEKAAEKRWQEELKHAQDAAERESLENIRLRMILAK